MRKNRKDLLGGKAEKRKRPVDGLSTRKRFEKKDFRRERGVVNGGAVKVVGESLPVRINPRPSKGNMRKGSHRRKRGIQSQNNSGERPCRWKRRGKGQFRLAKNWGGEGTGGGLSDKRYREDETHPKQRSTFSSRSYL